MWKNTGRRTLKWYKISVYAYFIFQQMEGCVHVVLSNVDGCHVFECFEDAKQFCKDAALKVSKAYATSANERYYCAKDTHTWVISTQSVRVNRKRKHCGE